MQDLRGQHQGTDFGDTNLCPACVPGAVIWAFQRAGLRPNDFNQLRELDGVREKFQSGIDYSTFALEYLGVKRRPVENSVDESLNQSRDRWKFDRERKRVRKAETSRISARGARRVKEWLSKLSLKLCSNHEVDFSAKTHGTGSGDHCPSSSPNHGGVHPGVPGKESSDPLDPYTIACGISEQLPSEKVTEVVKFLIRWGYQPTEQTRPRVVAPSPGPEDHSNT